MLQIIHMSEQHIQDHQHTLLRNGVTILTQQVKSYVNTACALHAELYQTIVLIRILTLYKMH